MKKASKWETVRLGVRRIRDIFAKHPDGYRYRLSPAAMRDLVVKKVREQGGCCSICGKEMVVMDDVVPDHREPRGMGGSFRDDRPDNIGAAHSWCNLAKGSKREVSHG